MRRYGLIFALSIVTTVAAVACGDSSTGSSPETALAQTVVPPTFVQLIVTPAPIDTPVPTLAPTAGPRFSDAELADPVFPDWLDPELTAEQPEDDVIFAGWQEYLTDTHIDYTEEDGTGGTVHFCDEGTVVGADGEIDETVLWGVTRTAAMSTLKWGQVAITLDILAGDFAGVIFTVLVISREGGMVMQTGWVDPAELTITRSRLCLEMFPPEAASAVGN